MPGARNLALGSNADTAHPDAVDGIRTGTEFDEAPMVYGRVEARGPATDDDKSRVGRALEGGVLRGSARFVSRHPRLWVPLLAVAGSLVGWAVVNVGRGTSETVDEFSETPQFAIWLGAMSVQVALWAALSFVTTAAFRTLNRDFSRGRGRGPTLMYVAFSAVAIPSFFLMTPIPAVPLKHWPERLYLLTLLGFSVAFPPIRGMWSVQMILDGLRADFAQQLGAAGAPTPEPSTTPPTTAAVWTADHVRLIAVLRRLRAQLQFFLAATGALVGAATLVAGALRNAVIAWSQEEADHLPVEHVVVFGLSLTIFLAAIYLPVYVTLEERGRAFVEGALPMPSDRIPNDDWLSERQRLEAILQLGIRPVESFRSGVAILAPLAGSLISTFLPSVRVT